MLDIGLHEALKALNNASEKMSALVTHFSFTEGCYPLLCSLCDP